MSRVTARTAVPHKKILLTAIALALAANATSVFADDAAAEDDQRRTTPREESELETVHVEGAKIKNSPKYTELLVDTPQAISIIPEEVIKEQNLLTLRDILSTLPGITFGAGEGGGGYGDSINLRGFSGSNDITIDGVRDSAQYTRTDPFNLEQVELVNGANSVYSGAGSVGGSINLVSKAARLGDSTSLSAGVGSDSYARVTADTNHMVGETTAVRFNLMGHRNDVPGRDYEDFSRWGFAPSIAFGLGTDTRVTLSYLHQEDDNLPQYGVPFYAGRPLDGVDPSNFYGYHHVDTQEVEVDSFTAVIEHEFSDALSLRNLARVQRVDQLTVVDAVQGVWCLPNNLTPTGTACTSGSGATLITVPVGSYLPSGPRGLVRDTTNKTLYNQTDFTTNFNTGAIAHTLVTGLSFMHETFELDTSTLFRNPDGSNPYAAPNHLPFMDLYDPDSRYTGPINKLLTGKTDGELDNRALYAFDTLKFGEKWMLNLGARYERNEGSSTTYTVSSTGANIGQVTGAAAPAKNTDDLFSYRAGLVFKPIEAASIYLAYGNSKTPSKASVNGSCTPTSTTGTANCNVDPESAVNLELGAKWDLLDGKLSLTGSIFRNERENYRVADPDPLNPTGEQALDGRARVDGILLGVTGLITDRWSVYANYAHLDSEVLQGVSDYSSGLDQDYTKGDPLVNTPENSLSVWTTYDITRQWQVGYGATWQADNYVQQHSATYLSGSLQQSPDYWVHRAMVAWRVNRNLDLQLNVNNLTDKEYYTRIRNNGWATPGDGRQYTLTATYNF
jgi:catecholate siderophore receptor